jgi:hypothetical protein
MQDVPHVERGGASAPNRPLRRRLFERSEFPEPSYSGRRRRHPQGRAQAEMVLVPFAETKGTRRAGTTPRINQSSFQKHQT